MALRTVMRMRFLVGLNRSNAVVAVQGGNLFIENTCAFLTGEDDLDEYRQKLLADKSVGKKKMEKLLAKEERRMQVEAEKQAREERKAREMARREQYVPYRTGRPLAVPHKCSSNDNHLNQGRYGARRSCRT